MTTKTNNSAIFFKRLLKPFLWITEPSPALKLQKDILKAKLISSLLLAVTFFFAATNFTPENENKYLEQ